MTKEKAGLAELEESIKSLEALVEKLESGELPLEQALAEFERGVILTRRCQAALAEAEQRIEILLADADEPEPFEEDDEQDNEED
ncbi:MAG: exodeoxyribonuclease VII small subunit [Gammaproteobacteria bacterium]|jgi:exodeoxyribonuclease VII small subunit